MWQYSITQLPKISLPARIAGYSLVSTKADDTNAPAPHYATVSVKPVPKEEADVEAQISNGSKQRGIIPLAQVVEVKKYEGEPYSHYHDNSHAISIVDPYQRFSLDNVLGLMERAKYIESVEDCLTYIADQYVHYNCPVKPGGVTFYLKPINYMRLTSDEINVIIDEKYPEVRKEDKAYREKLAAEIVENELKSLSTYVESLVKCRHCIKTGRIPKRIGCCRRFTRMMCRMVTLDWLVTDTYKMAMRKRTYLIGFVAFTLIMNLGKVFEQHEFYTASFWIGLLSWTKSLFFLVLLLAVILVTKMFEVVVYGFFTTEKQRLRRKRYTVLDLRAKEADDQFKSHANDYWSAAESDDEDPDPTSSDPDVKFLNDVLWTSKKIGTHKRKYRADFEKKNN